MLKIIASLILLTVSLGARSTPEVYTDTGINCGVVGDYKTDDTAAWQMCLNTLSPGPGHTIFVTSGIRSVISSTLNITGSYGFQIIVLGPVFGGPSAGTQASAIYWNGAADGTMLNIQNSQNFLIDGLTLFSSMDYDSGTGGAATGINIDQKPADSPITTNGELRHVSIQGTQRNPNFRAITFALTSNSNVEHMAVRDSIVTCSYGGKAGQGIVIGGSQNAFNHVYERDQVGNCNQAFSINGGGAVIRDAEVNTNYTHFWVNGNYAPVIIENADSENATFFLTGSPGGTVTVRDSRIAATTPPAGQCEFYILGGDPLILQGNWFQQSGVPHICGLGPYAAPGLLMLANAFPDTLQKVASSMTNTIGYGVLSIMDQFVPNSPNNGGAAQIQSLGAAEYQPSPASPSGAAQWGALTFVGDIWNTGVWKISINGAAYIPIN